MRKKSGGDQHENLDRWLLTYADMITLLMAFFIMMYSMSVLNLAKFREAAISIRSGFGGAVKGQGKSILGSSGMFSASPSPIEGDTAGVAWNVLKPLITFIERGSNSAQVQIGEDRRGIVITLKSDSLLFKPGESEINPLAYPVLNRIAFTLKQIQNRISIEGHTCDLQPRSGRYPSNWELSTSRATNVLRYLVERRDMPAQRFAAAGYGSVRPLVPNTNEANRARNRRVEIVLLRPEADETSQARGQPRRISDPHEIVIRRPVD